MDDRQRDLDRRIRRAQRQEFFRNLWEARVVVVAGIALLAAIGFGISFQAAPTSLDATVTGHIVNDGGVVTTRKGSQYHHETVALDNGYTITLDLPGDKPVRKEANMKVEIWRKDWGPLHQVTYRFGGYADETPQS